MIFVNQSMTVRRDSEEGYTIELIWQNLIVPDSLLLVSHEVFDTCLSSSSRYRYFIGKKCNDHTREVKYSVPAVFWNRLGS